MLEELEKRFLLATISLSGGTLNVTTLATVDVITASVAGATLTLSINEGGPITNYTNTTSVVLGMVINAGNSGDTINLGTISIPTYVFGGNGNDTITGGNGNDTLQGGNGDDSITGGGGNDLLDGGLNNDTLAGSGGNDSADYSGRALAVDVALSAIAFTTGNGETAIAESDRINTDVESVLGGGGADFITGSTIGNYLSGGAGNDTLAGDNGNDILVGGAGNDAMYGNNDSDSIFAMDGEFDVVDGGPGADSAQVDVVPAEAPLPGDLVISAAPMAAPLPTSTTQSKAVQPKKSIFASRPQKRVAKRPIATVAPLSSPRPMAAPLPGPLPSDDVETFLQGYDQIFALLSTGAFTPLDPYAFGQVFTTRNINGGVVMDGTQPGTTMTNGDDVFIVESPGPGVPGIRVFNNGGMTEYPLASSPIFINGQGGNDKLIVRGGPGSSATFTPSQSTPGAGEINLDGHIIQFSVMQRIEADLGTFGLITPNANDTVNIGQPTADDPVTIGGQSGGVGFGPVALTQNVLDVTINTGINDSAGGTDVINTFNMDPAIAPTFAIMPGQSGKDNLIVNGPFTLSNNPTGPMGVRTMDVFVNGGGHLRFTSSVIELNSLLLQQGQATLADGGNKILSVRNLAIQSPGQLNIREHTLIVDHANGSDSGDIPSLIKSGYDPAAPTHWNGFGITSSIAASEPNRAVGFNESALLFGPAGGGYRGYQIDGEATIVTLTIPGDVNLDRQITFADLLTVAANFGSPAFWYKGNFNYNNEVDFSDLLGTAANFGLTIP